MASANDEAGTAKDHLTYRPPKSEEPSIQLEELIERIRNSINIPGIGGGGSAILLGAIVLIVGVIWLATGFFTVSPDEQAALRTFGKFQAIQGAGLHWHWPRPIGNRDIVSVTRLRQLELGFRSGTEGVTVARSVEAESLMITGDENIVDVQAVVQYRISNIRNYLFEVGDPGDPDRLIPAGRPDGRTLRDIGESALRQVVGSRNIDDVLTTEKEQVQADVLLKMRELADFYRTGIDIESVLLQNVNPPREVQGAFEDVVRAREDRETTINRAQAYEADQIPKAQGRAAQIIEEAQAFKDGRIAKAQGEADGFLAILEGYKISPDITRRRLYLEAMEDILPGVKKIILANDSGVLPFLPLNQAPLPAAAPSAGGGQ